MAGEPTDRNAVERLEATLAALDSSRGGVLSISIDDARQLLIEATNNRHLKRLCREARARFTGGERDPQVLFPTVFGAKRDRRRESKLPRRAIARRFRYLTRQLPEYLCEDNEDNADWVPPAHPRLDVRDALETIVAEYDFPSLRAAWRALSRQRQEDRRAVAAGVPLTSLDDGAFEIGGEPTA